MWQIGPIFRILMRRKFGVFLLVLQIAFATTIVSNLAFVIGPVNKFAVQASGAADRQLFAVAVRPVNTLISYADAERNVQALLALDNVERVAAMRWAPLGGLSEIGLYRASAANHNTGTPAMGVDVSHQALFTLGLKVIAGRDFSAADMRIKTDSDNPVSESVIITRLLAVSLFGKEQDAVGKLIYRENIASTVIGVADNWLGFTMPFINRTERTVFYPRYDATDTEHRYLIRAKSPQDRAAAIDAAEQLLTHTYKNEILIWAEKTDEYQAKLKADNRLIINLLTVVNVALGCIVAFAISGQTLFWITQRTKQIGVRRALGATRAAIVMQVLIENAMICLPGLLIGILFSLMVNRLVMQVTQLPPMSPLLLLTTCLSLLGLCLASAAVPALRASKISPSLATRSV